MDDVLDCLDLVCKGNVADRVLVIRPNDDPASSLHCFHRAWLIADPCLCVEKVVLYDVAFKKADCSVIPMLRHPS